jgi:hypothetical protein
MEGGDARLSEFCVLIGGATTSSGHKYPHYQCFPRRIYGTISAAANRVLNYDFQVFFHQHFIAG